VAGHLSEHKIHIKMPKVRKTMVMLPYSIVSSLDYYRKLYQPNKYVLKDNLQVSHTTGSAQAVMRAALKNLASKNATVHTLRHSLPLIC
jgi:hypothetical protein